MLDGLSLVYVCARGGLLTQRGIVVGWREGSTRRCRGPGRGSGPCEEVWEGEGGVRSLPRALSEAKLAVRVGVRREGGREWALECSEYGDI